MSILVPHLVQNLFSVTAGDSTMDVIVPDEVGKIWEEGDDG